MEHADATSLVTDNRIQLVSIGLSGIFCDASRIGTLTGTLTSGNPNMNAVIRKDDVLKWADSENWPTAAFLKFNCRKAPEAEVHHSSGNNLARPKCIDI